MERLSLSNSDMNSRLVISCRYQRCFTCCVREAYGTGYQSDYSGGESDLHIVSHGSNISAGQSCEAGPIGINVPIRPKIGPSLVRVLEMAKSLSAAISKLANKRCTCAGVSRASIPDAYR